MPEVEHKAKPGHIVLVVLAFALLLAVYAFNALSAIGVHSIFKNDIGNLSDKYNLEITPAGWTFSIWGVIYTAQGVMMIYCLTLLCRSNKYGNKLYSEPLFLPPWFFFVYCISSVCNITWLVAFDREYLVASFLALFGIYFCILTCLFLSFKYLWDHETELSKVEIWLNIVLVQNSLGLYGAWTGIATLLNFGIVLRYEGDVSMDITCYSCLAILLAEILLYFFIDVLVATKRLRYFLTPYMVLGVALAGIIYNICDSKSGVGLFTMVLAGIVGILFICKIIAIVYYAIKQPISIESCKINGNV